MMLGMKSALSFCVVSLLVAIALPASATRLLVTIEPLAMLAEPLLAPGDELHTLLPSNRSPHHYALKASDMALLDAADLVVWVGPDMEQFLQKILRQQPRSLRLDLLPTLHWPASSDGHHHHGDRDPHLWLNPDNGKVVVLAIAEKLAQLQPQDGDGYRTRAAAFIARLDQLALQLDQQLLPLKASPFMVYHDGYGHWVERFGLPQAGAVTLTPEQKPSAKQLYKLQQQAQGLRCLYAEALYNNDSSRATAQQLKLTLVEVDPLGVRLPPSEYRYESLLTRLAADMLSCR